MIKAISLYNYKCFEKADFELSDINLFFGLNGRGKSSVLQSILLMSQSVQEINSLKELVVSANFLKLGEFKDVKNSYSENNFVKFEFKTDIEKIDSFSFEYIKNEQYPDRGILSEFELNGNKSSEETISDSNTNTSINKSINYKDDSRILNIFKNIHYVSADRIGPRLFVDKFGIGNLEKTDSRGENSINILSSNKEKLNENLFIGEKIPNNLTELCQMWLSYIFDGANIEVNNKGESVLALNLSSRDNGLLYKSVNVGFGYSYILSIVITCLLAKESDIVIFENPEAHLHPKAQSRLVQLFTRLSLSKVQLFIESHSEHILNGLRVGIANKSCSITEESVKSYFFDENYKIEKLNIDNKGFVSNWPKDFFDQSDIDNSLIFKHSRV